MFSKVMGWKKVILNKFLTIQLFEDEVIRVFYATFEKTFESYKVKRCCDDHFFLFSIETNLRIVEVLIRFHLRKAVEKMKI